MKDADPYREESDAAGAVCVPSDRIWGAQTQRALEYFPLVQDRLPMRFLQALCAVKKACAQVNADSGRLAAATAHAIVQAADAAMQGKLDAEFPLSVWQTGSASQTHMNVNEVLANRASLLLAGGVGPGRLVHPIDDVSLGQSTHDVVSTAMNVAAGLSVNREVLPQLEGLRAELAKKAAEFGDVVKISRIHLMDGPPISLGQEFSGYVAQLDHALAHLRHALPHVYELAIGARGGGPEARAPDGFGVRVARELSLASHLPFVVAPNRFEAASAHDALVHLHGAFRGVAVVLLKLANDLRWLASGPRGGLGEITLPMNERDPLRAPGATNPAQCEALAMICAQILGNDVAVGVGGASGNFELNTFKPLLIHSTLQSARLLADGSRAFAQFCVRGIRPREDRLRTQLEESLALAAALAPRIGYEAAGRIAEKAHREGITLRDAAIALKLVAPVDFDRWMRPDRMVDAAPARH